MSIRNIPFCSCQQLKSIIQQNGYSSLRPHTVYAYKRLFINKTHLKTPIRRYVVGAPNNGVQARNIDQYKTSSASGSVSAEELDKFKLHSAEWWKPDGEYTPIRSLNKLRVPLIRDILLRNRNNIHPNKPLSEFKILDVGCGGGILAEPLARLGADVLAIDPLPENIDAARAHAINNKELKTLSYECATIEDISERNFEYFDLVVASEVLEHVMNPNDFIRDCCNTIKPGGHMVVTTINRTILSTLLVKYAAEYLFRIVPQNTHDENKFIQPGELTDMLRESDMIGINFRGMIMNPLTYHWSWTDGYPMNYTCYAKKP